MGVTKSNGKTDEVVRTNSKDQQATAMAILAAMGLANVFGGDKDVTTDTVEGDTEQIIIPRGMSKIAASKELRKQHDEEENEIELLKDFEGWNGMDVLAASMRAMKSTFGWVNSKATYSMFGKNNPKEIEVVVDIKNGKKKTEPAFLGRVAVSAWEDAFIDTAFKQDGSAFIKVTGKKKYSERVRKLFATIEEELLQNSIYRGKSMVIDSDNSFQLVENKGSKDIILNEDEERVIKNLIIAPLGQPGKRCVLFTGEYGTGKTETAMRIGRAANDRGMSFFYVKDATKFSEVLKASKNYLPAVVFTEDIDEIAEGEQRDAEMNKMLNTLDGFETKGNNITVIFTTNHENRINKALRRPGRIDNILRFKRANPDTAVKIYTRLLEKTAGFGNTDVAYVVGLQTEDLQGAVLAEVAKRAKLMVEYSDDKKLSTEILQTAFESMQDQIEFMKADPENTDDPRLAAYETLFGGALDKLVTESAATLKTAKAIFAKF